MPSSAATTIRQRLDALKPQVLAVAERHDLDAEQVLLICQEALPGVLAAIRTLEASRKEGP